MAAPRNRERPLNAPAGARQGFTLENGALRPCCSDRNLAPARACQSPAQHL